MSNPFDDADATFLVLVNDEGQHSLWPVFADVLAGWTVALPATGRQECLDWVGGGELDRPAAQEPDSEGRDVPEADNADRSASPSADSGRRPRLAWVHRLMIARTRHRSPSPRPPRVRG